MEPSWNTNCDVSSITMAGKMRHLDVVENGSKRAPMVLGHPDFLQKKKRWTSLEIPQVVLPSTLHASAAKVEEAASTSSIGEVNEKADERMAQVTQEPSVPIVAMLDRMKSSQQPPRHRRKVSVPWLDRLVSVMSP